jgi:hypothetical protein
MVCQDACQRLCEKLKQPVLMFAKGPMEKPQLRSEGPKWRKMLLFRGTCGGFFAVHGLTGRHGSATVDGKLVRQQVLPGIAQVSH